MKQSIQQEELFVERFFFSKILHLLVSDVDDDSEVVLSFVKDVGVIDERRSKFKDTKQILS